MHPTPPTPWWTPLTPSRSPQCPLMLPIPCWPLGTYTPYQPQCTPDTPWWPPMPLHPLGAPNAPILLLDPEHLHSLPAPMQPGHLLHPLMVPNASYHPTNAPHCSDTHAGFQLSSTDHLHHYVQFTIYHLVYNCHHFTTDCLHEYFQFTIYHLEVSRVHLQCCEAQPISAVSPKTCTLKLQFLCNTERPTNWSGHGKMIDPPWRTSTYKRPFIWEGNYLVFNCCHFATDHLHKYVQFTIYHLEVSRVHLQCCEAQPISAVSPKTCTLKLQLLHNTERLTKRSGHGKMIDPPGELLHTKDLLPKRVTI